MLQAVEQLESHIVSEIKRDMERLRQEVEASLNFTDSGYVFEELVELAESGQWQWWSDDASFCMSCITDTPKRKVCYIPIAGGKLEDVLAIHDRIKEFAIAQDADCMACGGRLGWAKMMKARGYRVYSECVLDLRENQNAN